jgi:capsular polysaccharide export protein
MMKKIVFVANSSKRYRYYSLIANRIKNQAQVIFPVYPTLSLLLGAFKKAPVDEGELLDSHLRRQKINYPALSKSPLLWKVFCFFAYVTERSRFYHYYHIFKKLDCETVAIWNGQKQPYITMVKAAEFAKKRILFFENGLLPNTTTADYAGVNAHNCLPRDPEFYLQLNDIKQSAILPTKLVVRDPHKKREVTGQKLSNLPKRYIFIPFQVPADSQIVIHSPWVHSMEQMYHLVLNAHKKLREQGHTDIPHLVFKEHPSWPGNFDDLYELDECCLFANENNTQELIENAEAVITINSTVGLESLLLGKKVVTLGNACYNIEQLVLHADNESEFFEVMSKLADWQVNETLRQNFLNFIATTYCIPNGWEKMLGEDAATHEQHLEAMVKRIFENDDLANAVGAQ